MRNWLPHLINSTFTKNGTKIAYFIFSIENLPFSCRQGLKMWRTREIGSCCPVCSSVMERSQEPTDSVGIITGYPLYSSTIKSHWEIDLGQFHQLLIEAAHIQYAVLENGHSTVPLQVVTIITAWICAVSSTDRWTMDRQVQHRRTYYRQPDRPGPALLLWRKSHLQSRPSIYLTILCRFCRAGESIAQG